MAPNLKAGAAATEITPKNTQFLYGYPHVERYSTGVHDSLFSSALYLSDGKTAVIFIANDIIFVGKCSAQNIRNRIAKKIPVPPENIMVTATHTHSGPNTVEYISNQGDPVIPPVDTDYVQFMEERNVEAAVRAFQNAGNAQAGLAIADGSKVGTNRRDPKGPADPQVPVLVVRNAEDKTNIACMLVCSMHPTVLHEDSMLVSADFPGMARKYLQDNVLGDKCVTLHHTGPAGNQSPRHVTTANTFEEADRLGTLLAKAVENALCEIKFHSQLDLHCRREFVDLPRKNFPSLEKAQENLKNAVEKLENLKKAKAPRQQIRTAECDWFGAEETLTLAEAARDGKLDMAYRRCLPAEIQMIKVGNWIFVGWPGEIFIEYALDVKRNWRDTFIISLANGELQGYVVTPKAAKEGGYEASNALFPHQTGQILVHKTTDILQNSKQS